jgi:virulence factor Mce-like protein
MPKFTAGVLGILALVVITYLGFSKFALPFGSNFTVHAVFPTAQGLRPDSLVRIAGVNVGKVKNVTHLVSSRSKDGAQASDVTMEINDQGLPIHEDATFRIRPRIFLEGNFFVDVSPGSPSAPAVPDGHTFPIQQGSAPVQLDQVLTSLQSDTRHNLQVLLRELGTGLSKGGPAYNASIQYWLPAYEYSSIVNHDALGIQPHDLSGWIAQMATVSGALDAHPQNLQSLITDFNTTANAFARQNAALSQTVAELPRTLATATPALNSLNAAFPPLRAFARALDPGVRNASRAIDASLPFISQLRLLVRPSELGGLATDLAVSVPALANLTNTTVPFMRDGVRPASSCISNVVSPWSHLTLNDPNFNASNGFPPREAYIEAVDFLPGLAGETRALDANGPYIRILGGSGMFTYSLQPGLLGQALAPINAVQPQPPPNATRPPLVGGDPGLPNVPCETQPAIKTLNDAPAGQPPRAIDTNLSAPGAKARYDADTQALLASLRNLIKLQGLPYKVADVSGHR